MADTPDHTRRERITIAQVTGTLHRLSQQYTADPATLADAVAELRQLVAGYPADKRAHLLAHAVSPGPARAADDTLLRDAGADMAELERLRARPVGQSLLSGIAAKLNGRDGVQGQADRI